MKIEIPSGWSTLVEYVHKTTWVLKGRTATCCGTRDPTDRLVGMGTTIYLLIPPPEESPVTSAFFPIRLDPSQSLQRAQSFQER